MGTLQPQAASKISVPRTYGFAVAILALTCSLAGQEFTSVRSAAATGPRYTVTGTVVNSITNEPIRRALVSLNGSESKQTFTGADGRFQISDVPEGQVYVMAQRPGFLASSNPGNGVIPTGALTVGPGTNDVRVPLIPEAAIQGTIVNAEGEPVEGVSVLLSGEQIADGRKQVGTRGVATTDDTGAFRFDQLTPEKVTLSTMEKLENGSRWDGPVSAYPPMFYPGTPEASAAQPIELRAGETVSANLTINQVPTYSISGVMAGSSGCNSVGLTTQNPVGSPFSIGMLEPNLQTGRFLITGVPAGHWKFVFQCNESAANRLLWAEQDATVVNSNLAGMTVVLQPLPEIPVRFISASESGGTDLQASVSQPYLLPVDPANVERYYAQPRRNTNRGPADFVFMNVPPGQYKIEFQNSGFGCLDSVSSGRTDLARDLLTLSPGAVPEPIVAAVRRDCSSISARIQSNGENVRGIVVLVADSIPVSPVLLMNDPHGGSGVTQVAPGTYHAYAFSDVLNLEYANPDAMRDFASRTLELRPGQETQVTLDLIDRGTK